MKRSNRLLILLGIVLAVVAFGAVLLLSNGGGSGSANNANATPAPVTVVVTTQAIPVGTVVTADMLATKALPADSVPVDAFKDPAQVVGLIMRRDKLAGDVVSASDFTSLGSTTNADLIRRLQKGFRAMAVQVDQVTGVGTLIQPGDHVDVVLAMEGTDNKFPVVSELAPTKEGTPPTTVRNFKAIGPDLINRTTVKILVQDVEVLGTLLPPPPAATNNAQATPAPSSGTSTGSGGTTLNGQQEIAILALTPQQVELVRFAQLDGELSLILRSTADQGAPPAATTGVTLRILVDKYQVIPPQIVLQAPPSPVPTP